MDNGIYYVRHNAVNLYNIYITTKNQKSLIHKTDKLNLGKYSMIAQLFTTKLPYLYFEVLFTC